MLTLTDLINARISAAGAQNESDIIRYILKDDLNSPQKKNMADGERYYAAEQDVLQKNFVGLGKTLTNRTRCFTINIMPSRGGTL